jgi:hypothetical protein
MNLVFASSFEEAAVATMALPLIAYIALLFWFSKSYKKVSGPVTMPTRRHMATAVADAGIGQSSETPAAGEGEASDETGARPVPGEQLQPPGPDPSIPGPAENRVEERDQTSIETDRASAPEADGAQSPDDAS